MNTPNNTNTRRTPTVNHAAFASRRYAVLALARAGRALTPLLALSVLGVGIIGPLSAVAQEVSAPPASVGESAGPAGLADDSQTPSLSLGAGMAVTPVYEGSSAYTVRMLPLLKAAAPTGDWGTFTAAFPEGLRWDLPTGERFGVALLTTWDEGRKESIRTLSGHDHHLAGMGDLGGTAMGGVELSVNYAPYRFFVRGMQALRERHYGGENLGHTAYADLGLGSQVPLGDDLSMSTQTYVTWSDRHDMMSRFGVTPEQALASGYHEHRVGGGLRSMTMAWGLDWRWTPQVTLSGGVQVSGLTSSAVRNSPLTEKNVSGALYLNALYRF